MAEEVNRARDLINTPPNDLNPKSFAAAVQAAAKEHGLKVEVLDEKALAKGGYGGIMGVGQGSATPPRLVRVALHATPRRTRPSRFVGKGITYDSGGISLKPAGHNETMKCDMSGAAAVFAAVVAAARLGLQVNVTGWLALAENMPCGSRHPPRRRAADVQRQDRRGAQHRRRGPAGAGRRAGPRLARRTRTRSSTWRR